MRRWLVVKWLGSWLKIVLKVLRILKDLTDLAMRSGLIYRQILNMFLNAKHLIKKILIAGIFLIK